MKKFASAMPKANPKRRVKLDNFSQKLKMRPKRNLRNRSNTMDPWLTDDLKELLFTPCLLASEMIGRKLDNRLRMSQEMDERALTEMLVDALDTSSAENTWGNVLDLLRDHHIYLSSQLQKCTQEHLIGADIGLTISRHVHGPGLGCHADYCALIQCKKIDSQKCVDDFFHEVRSTKKKQSSLLLDITPSSFYFIFTPPSLLDIYCSIEPIAFALARPGCSSAIWNRGSFEFNHVTHSVLTAREKAEATGVLVVPALAVEAQAAKGKGASLEEILPNCLPLWYWFGELFIPGFIGDRRQDVLKVAHNLGGNDNLPGVQYSLNFNLGNG